MSGSLRAFWTAPPDGGAAITAYKLRYRPGSSGAWTTVSAAIGSATFYDVTGLTASTTYQVQVRAQNSIDESSWSTSGAGTTSNAPGDGASDTLTTTRTFDAGTGQVTSVTDPNRAVTSYTYDTFGRLTQVLQPGDSTTAPTVAYTYAYGSVPNRLLTVARDGSADGGRHTVQFYDGLGRLIATKTELADNVNNQGRHSVVRQLYTDRDLVAKAYVPSGTPAQSSSDFLTKFEYVENVAGHPFTSPTYDGAGRVTQVTAPDGAVTTTSYGDGQRTLTDANGHQRVEYTDGYGRLRRVDEVDEAARPPTTTYAYDLLGNLTSVTDAAGNRTTITYDGLGRKTQVQDPDTGTWRYGYDALGRLTRQTDAVGNRLTFSYDLAGRLTQQQGTPPDGTAYTTGWSYDSLDRPVTLTYPDGEVSPPDMGRTGCQ